MNIKDKVKQARYAAAVQAGERWKRRRAEREHQQMDLAASGPGAADSPERQKNFAAREHTRDVARGLSARGLLPKTLERRIGPSLDWGYYAPSDAARQAGRPVARITYMPERGVVAEPIATGFLVSPRLLMTNHHVIGSKAEARGLGANFLFEYGDRGLATGRYYELDPDSFFHADPALDFALVGLKGRSLESEDLSDLGFTPLIEATPKILIGQPVNIIQHPEGQAKTYAVSRNRLVDILDDGFLHYETDTLEGSSGSPAFSANWELVALHHSGVPRVVGGKILTREGRAWDPDIMADDEVDWVANEGCRVSHIVGALRNHRMPTEAEQSLLDELLGATGDPLRAVEKIAAVETAAGEPSAMPLNVFNFSGPVTIHVHAAGGDAPMVLADITKSASVVALDLLKAVEKKQNFDKNYAKRRGYEADFLGFTLPQPTVLPARLGEMYRDHDGDVVELKYHHFSVAMNETRRLCMWAASNADYTEGMRDERPRDAFGGEDWREDPRLPTELQILNEEFYGPATNVDRGHVVRRDDNCWGETRLEREYANADSYHWTNCTPQHEAFNQERPKGAQYRDIQGLWGGLESHLVRQLKGMGNRASQFAGPVLDNANDPHRDYGSGDIQYPTRFWKIIAVVGVENQKPRLYVYGFLLDQSDVIGKFKLEERIELGKFAAQARPLTEIEALTGLTFAKIFHDHDEIAAHGAIPLDGSESLRPILPAEAVAGGVAAAVHTPEASAGEVDA